jgi:signal peptidase II
MVEPKNWKIVCYHRPPIENRGRVIVPTNNKSIATTGFVALGVLLVDLLTKGIAMRAVGPSAGRRERWFVGNWLGLSYSENSGIAFGLMRNSSTLALVLAIVAAIMALGAFVWANRADRRIVLAGALIAGGATGNMIDRVRFAYVRDFAAIGPWPPFNIADSAITIGALIAAYALLRPVRQEDQSNQIDQRTVPLRPAALDATE